MGKFHSFDEPEDFGLGTCHVSDDDRAMDAWRPDGATTDAIVAELRKRAETRRARAVTCCAQGRHARSLEHREAARALDDAADWASKVPA